MGDISASNNLSNLSRLVKVRTTTGLVIGRFVISRQKTLVCGRQTRNDYLQKTNTYRPITRPDQSIILSTDYRTGYRNVSHYQQQQSSSGLRSPRRSNSTYFWCDSWVETFHSFTHAPYGLKRSGSHGGQWEQAKAEWISLSCLQISFVLACFWSIEPLKILWYQSKRK